MPRHEPQPPAKQPDCPECCDRGYTLAWTRVKGVLTKANLVRCETGCAASKTWNGKS